MPNSDSESLIREIHPYASIQKFCKRHHIHIEVEALSQCLESIVEDLGASKIKKNGLTQSLASLYRQNITIVCGQAVITKWGGYITFCECVSVISFVCTNLYKHVANEIKPAFVKQFIRVLNKKASLNQSTKEAILTLLIRTLYDYQNIAKILAPYRAMFRNIPLLVTSMLHKERALCSSTQYLQKEVRALSLLETDNIYHDLIVYIDKVRKESEPVFTFFGFSKKVKRAAAQKVYLYLLGLSYEPLNKKEFDAFTESDSRLGKIYLNYLEYFGELKLAKEKAEASPAPAKP